MCVKSLKKQLHKIYRYKRTTKLISESSRHKTTQDVLKIHQSITSCLYMYILPILMICSIFSPFLHL